MSTLCFVAHDPGRVKIEVFTRPGPEEAGRGRLLFRLCQETSRRPANGHKWRE
jgi:hypothetical protein